MQFIRKTLLAFAVLVTLFATGGHIFAAEATINGSGINIRSGPGTEYEPIGSAVQGQTYIVTGKENAWIEIELDGSSTGWVSEEFVILSEDETSANESEEVDVDSVTFMRNNVQLREGPSTDFDIVHFADKGETFDVISTEGEWYEVSDGKVEGFVLKKLTEANAGTVTEGFKNKTIVIDPGHGGRDVGAIGTSESFEKDIAFMTAEELASELTALGAEVYLTRDGDDFISLSSRASYSNVLDTDAFISLHYNSIPEHPDVTGIETFYYYDQYESLANHIQAGMIEETGEQDRGIEKGDFQVIRQSFKPGVLLELGFLSNSEAEGQLLTVGFQRKLAGGIVRGLGKYFSETK